MRLGKFLKIMYPINAVPKTHCYQSRLRPQNTTVLVLVDLPRVHPLVRNGVQSGCYMSVEVTAPLKPILRSHGHPPALGIRSPSMTSASGVGMESPLAGRVESPGVFFGAGTD